MPTCSQEPIEPENQPTVIPGGDTLNYKIAGISLDDAYIFNFTNNPRMNKSEALRLAGWEGNPKNIRQEAYRRHNRLRPKIQAVTNELLTDLGTLANHQLHNILQSDVETVGQQAMLAAIKMGLDASNSKASPLEPIEQRNTEQLDNHIQKLMSLISDAEGNG